MPLAQYAQRFDTATDLAREQAQEAGEPAALAG